MVNPATTVETPQVAEVIVINDNFKLDRSDRCDACNSQAFYRVEFKSGSELTFCAHHFNENKEKLVQLDVTIFNESAQLG